MRTKHLWLFTGSKAKGFWENPRISDHGRYHFRIGRYMLSAHVYALGILVCTYKEI